MDSDTYALAYGNNNGAQICALTISADGSTITLAQTLLHDSGASQEVKNSIVKVDSDTYALAFRGTNSDGFITTFTISSDGSTITEVASLEHDTDNGTWNSLVQVDSDTYALTYAGTDADGYIKTFTISSDGSTITEVASFEHDAGNGEGNSIVQNVHHTIGWVDGLNSYFRQCRFQDDEQSFSGSDLQ